MYIYFCYAFRWNWFFFFVTCGKVPPFVSFKSINKFYFHLFFFITLDNEYSTLNHILCAIHIFTAMSHISSIICLGWKVPSQPKSSFRCSKILTKPVKAPGAFSPMHLSVGLAGHKDILESIDGDSEKKLAADSEIAVPPPCGSCL